MASSAREYPWFDWLRIALASLVYWEHAHVTTLASPGNFAVQVFFALSGWLIGGILLQTDRSGLPRFFYNRVTRIWLPYGAAVALLYTVAALKEGFAPFYFQALGFDLTLTHNWFITKIPGVVGAMPLQGTGSHFWSIAVEEQFYLVAPLLLVLTPIRRSILAWAALTVLAIVDAGFYGSISAGVLAAMLHRRFGDWHLRGWAVLGLAVVLAVASWAVWTGRADYARAVPVIAAAIVLLAARPGHRTTAGVFVGGISYPMYLHHWTGLFAAGAIWKMVPGIGKLPAFTAGFLFALAVAAVAYLLIDRQVLRHRGAIYTPALGRAAAISAYGLLATGILLAAVFGPLDGPPPC